ncbi:MAG: TonB-dependent receptor [Candidatus Eremiobacteraeota bacterium]|nr:TonB-dependent receptor [Candidatus Eremiobacteraeota bacterium]
MLHTLVAACCLIVGNVHAPSGAAIANASVVVDGSHHAQTTTDSKGNFSLAAPPGRYVLTAIAGGFATLGVSLGDVATDDRVEIVLEPLNVAKLRTIGEVTVNGGYALVQDVIPELNVSRATMDALGYTNLTSALEQLPSAILQHPDSGSPAAPEVVSLRGPDPSEALVTLDGQTLNDGNTGDVDISQFPVQAFQSVDVIEGLGPADSEGSNTFGGAVNLVSLQPTQTDRASLSTSIGSYGTSMSWLNATGTAGKIGYALAGSNFQSAGQTDRTALVYPQNDIAPSCGTPQANCPVLVHLGSSISARMGLANLDYVFSQRADAGVRIFTLGDNRDESSAINGIAGDEAGNPVYGQFVGPGSGVFAQSIRAYDAHDRSVLGSGTLLANASASNDNVDFNGSSGVSPYDVSHADKRYNESLSWGRTFDTGEFAFGGYLRQESLTGSGIAGPLAQSIQSYFVRGSREIGSALRLSGALYDADYSTFGNSLDWRLGINDDLNASTSIHASVGTGFRAPLLIERYFFPAQPDGRPNASLPEDYNCVVLGQGNPNERPEHATEYELGFSKLFSRESSLDVSFYRSNLRDTIENYYPYNANGPNGSWCGKYSPQGFAYEIPINIGNAVYEGAEARFRQRLNAQMTAVFSYGLNVAYPYALGPNVSNPTSGGALVDNQQFLGVPQQQGAATLIWAQHGWHAAVAGTFAGTNNTLHQQPYMLVDTAVGKTFGRVDLTISANNIFNAVAGPFTILNAGVPYRGNAGGSFYNPTVSDIPTNALFVQPATVRFALTVHE